MDAAQQQDVAGLTSVAGAAASQATAASLSRERQHSSQESSSFSFQKSFQESGNVEELMPAVRASYPTDQAVAPPPAYQLTAADVLAATSIVDLTNRLSEDTAMNSANQVTAEPQKLSYEASAFVTNLKFSISDEARFLQELGSSRTKVIAERRRKIEQLVCSVCLFLFCMLCSS
jgi:hypothetical protein